LEKGVERVWVIAARGGTASGKESEFLATKSAVEAVAITLVWAGGDGAELGRSLVMVEGIVAPGIGLMSARKPAPGTPSFRSASETCTTPQRMTHCVDGRYWIRHTSQAV